MPETEQGTVYIVDDDDAIRSGLTLLLQSFGYEVEAFSSGESFLTRCAAALPTCCIAILDLSMPVMNGLELQAELKRRDIRVPVVFLSGDGEIPQAVNAVQHGAVDFIEKPVVSDMLLNRVAEALALCAPTREEDDHDAAEIRSRIATLTSRERDVLEGIADGGTSRTIAAGLEISERTVELHRSRVLRKMGARNVTELLNRVIPVLGPR